jgi:Mce-associated membrane protein
MTARRLPIVLGLVLAVLLAGVATWFGLEARRVSRDADRLTAEAGRLAAQARARTEGVDAANAALVDPARTAELSGTLRPALEKVLSYDYRDLDATTRAVMDNLTGKALCEYDQLYGEVRRLAPEQRLVLTSKVRELGVTRLERTRASVLVFVDQRTTRADQGQGTASGAQFAVRLENRDGHWKISEFDFLGQVLPGKNGTPQC